MLPSLGTNAPTATCLVGLSYTRRVKHERLVDQIVRLAIGGNSPNMIDREASILALLLECGVVLELSALA
jgi:hypothetical protein